MKNNKNKTMFPSWWLAQSKHSFHSVEVLKVSSLKCLEQPSVAGLYFCPFLLMLFPLPHLPHPKASSHGPCCLASAMEESMTLQSCLTTKGSR